MYSRGGRAISLNIISSLRYFLSIFILALSLGLCLIVFQTAQAFTAADLTVINTVHASYINPLTGKRIHAYSNTVSITLLAVANIRLQRNIQRTVTAGQQLQLSHKLINLGNIVDDYSLSLTANAENDANLQALALYHDINANGKLDANEVKVSQLKRIAPEQVVHLLVVGTVPQHVSEGMLITLKLSARSLKGRQLGTKFAINIDSLEVGNSNNRSENRALKKSENKVESFIFEQNLAIIKQVSTDTAMMGDVLHYSITISNQTGGSLNKLQLHDVFPHGLKLLPETTRLDGKKYDNITYKKASEIIFDLGFLDKKQQLRLSYSARITATQVANKLVNKAYLTAINKQSQKIKSKTTHAEVNIKGIDVLSDKGTIFGKIAFDSRCGYQTSRYNNLLAIGGVKLYLENGRYAITDAAGDYTFTDLVAEQHVVKVDTLTLDKNLRLKLSDNRQLNDPRSYIINLKQSRFSRADFIVDCINGVKLSHKILAIIKKGNASLSDTDHLKPRSVKSTLKQSTAMLIDKEKMPTTQQIVKTITNKQAKKGLWLWPKDDLSVDGRFMAVVRSDVKKPILIVNGKIISEEKLGEQIGNRIARGQVLAWYGVKLKSGKNNIEIKGVDGRGKMLSLLKGVFKQPSRGVKIRITSLKKVLVADGGKSILPLKITILDHQGYPAMGDYFLTVAANEGSWVESDLQNITPGHQIKIINGEGIIHLRSSHQTGKIKISVKADHLKGETEIAQIAHLRPLFVTGYLSLTAGTEGTGNSRAKIFMQGRVLEDTHFTLSFDSDKQYDFEHSAFKKEVEESFYPLLGATNQQGKKARSRNKLFIKLEQDQHNILYGDYQTESFSNNDLARVRRSLTGIRANTKLGSKTKLQAHIAEQQDSSVVEEFRGNGTALNYQLKNKGFIENSEIIELIIRDKNNRGIVRYSENLKSMTDYSLDPVTGYLSFHRVIPSFDNNLNPVFIRISYNQQSEGKKHLVAGANIEHQLSEEITLGGNVNLDQQSDKGSQLGGAYLQYDAKDGSQFGVSIARMLDNKTQATGNAYQIKANKTWSKESITDLTLARADKDFRNPTGGILADRQEIKLTHTQVINKSSNLKAEVLQSKVLTTKKEQQSIGVKIQKRDGKWLLEGGVRHIRQQEKGTKKQLNTVLASAKRSMQILGKPVRLGASYEQDVTNAKNHHASLSADIAVTKDTSLYARYEAGKGLLESLDHISTQTSNTLTIGAKNKLSPRLEAYSEYRAKVLADNNSAESASGLRGVITLQKGLTLAPTVEVVKVIEGNGLNDSLSASVKIQDTRALDNKKYLRLETRQSNNSDYYALDGNYIKRLDDVWSAFVGEELRVTETKDKDINGSHTLTLGLAQRQRDNGKHNSTYLYQWKEQHSVEGTGNRSAHILSTQQHYKLTEDATISGRAAGKWQTTKLDHKNYQTDTLLMDAKASYDINHNMDIFAHAGIIGSEQFGEQQYSAGVGANLNLYRNLRLGVAYNSKGFKDNDLDPDQQNKDGLFLNLTLKADEDMFNWLAWKQKKQQLDKSIPIPTPKATISYRRPEVKKKKAPAPRHYMEKVLSGNSYFALGSAQLSSSGRQAIDLLAQELKRSGLRSMDILVEGHTDNVGSEINNKLLSEHRAESVAIYLSQLGLDLMEMDIEGKGETQPIANNKTLAGRARNRRVNILISGISDRY